MTWQDYKIVYAGECDAVHHWCIFGLRSDGSVWWAGMSCPVAELVPSILSFKWELAMAKLDSFLGHKAPAHAFVEFSRVTLDQYGNMVLRKVANA